MSAHDEQGHFDNRLFMQSPVAICVMKGASHRFVLANHAYRAMVNRQDLIGRTLVEVFPELQGSPIMAVFDRCYASGEPYSSDEFVTPLDVDGDGVAEDCFFRFNLVATRDDHGVVTGWMASSVEISALVRARREAEDARSLLETVIGQMHTGIVVAESPSGKTLYENRAVQTMLGPPAQLGLTLFSHGAYRAFHPNGRAYAESDYPVARVLRGERMIEQEVSVLDGHGNLRTLCINAAPVSDVSGEHVAAVVAFSDVTERRDAELQRRELLLRAQEARTQAEQASRAKDEFMALLGHELRNPLAPITTALYLMERMGDDKMQAQRQVIQRQVDHLVRLVDDLLDVSRVTGGKVVLKKHPIEVADVVARAIDQASPLFEERAHVLTVAAMPIGLHVHADLSRLSQVVCNLLTNAAKYTPAGGRVTIDARRDGDEAIICVRDTGVGIDAELLPRVFDLFSQDRQTLDRSRGGLGLGLSIVRSLVNMHGGSVSAHSDGVGQGSAFTVRLPLARPSDFDVPSIRPAPTPRPVLQERAPMSFRILVVDDNTDAASTLADALDDLGHRVAVAHDGPSALRVAADLEPQLGLLDIGLPGMDGYELARRLREQLGKQRVRLVAVTGYGQASDRQRALDAGFDAHVVKPLPMDTLEAILDDLAAETP